VVGDGGFEVGDPLGECRVDGGGESRQRGPQRVYGGEYVLEVFDAGGEVGKGGVWSGWSSQVRSVVASRPRRTATDSPITVASDVRST
jgi:hypothetical protein